MHDLALLAVTFAFLVPAGMFSVEMAISVSIFEILFGIFARNALGVESFPFLKLTASFAGIVLTFLAGAEVDSHTMRTRFKDSFLMGAAGFFAPFALVFAFVYVHCGWTWDASKIAGIALGTTSLAVVYAVLVESGMTNHLAGKLTMTSCFIDDLFVAIALSTLFVKPNVWTAVFAVASVAIVATAPATLRFIQRRYGDRVIELEIRVLFLMLLVLMVLGDWGSSHAMLPAFVLGLVLAPFFEQNRSLQRRLRTVGFSFVTPFFFFNSGLRISLPALAASTGLLCALLGLKLVAKFVGIYPLARRAMGQGAMYVTLLLSTGLTMGTLTSTYGLEKGIINEVQFGVLLASVIGSAIVPTFIAQRWFQPEDVGDSATAGRADPAPRLAPTIAAGE